MREEALFSEAGFFDAKDRLFTPAAVNTWPKPFSVALNPRTEDLWPLEEAPSIDWLCFQDFEVQAGYELREQGPMVVPPPDLLERFIKLADAPSSRIRKFAAQFGHLGVYATSLHPDHQDADSERLEYCDVWRYFAQVMFSLLKISAQMLAKGASLNKDWAELERVPELIRTMDVKDLQPPERTWRVIHSLWGRKHLGERTAMEFRLNQLLRLGNVRPWLKWDSEASRPSLVFNSPGLFPHLALQLCLRVLRRDAFVVCHHCHREFTPLERAPKLGQRSFCPECRDTKQPQRYASRDHQKRSRS